MTARKKLGDAIAFHLKKMGHDDRAVSSRIGVNVRDVERFRTGELVPDRHQWKRLCSQVAKQLYSIAGLHSDALREQDEEREASVRALRRNGHAQEVNGMAVTNFGDKILAAVTVPAPMRPVVEEPEEPLTAQSSDHYSRPVGWRSVDQRQERFDRAVEIVRARPKISTRGPDGLIAILQKEFGVGLSDENIGSIRELVAREHVARDAVVQAAARDASRTAPAAPEVVTAKVRESDVSAGVELIIGAIPGLQEMTISVDDQGVASVNYSVRRVEITTVSSSLTVRR